MGFSGFRSERSYVDPAAAVWRCRRASGPWASRRPPGTVRASAGRVRPGTPSKAATSAKPSGESNSSRPGSLITAATRRPDGRRCCLRVTYRHSRRPRSTSTNRCPPVRLHAWMSLSRASLASVSSSTSAPSARSSSRVDQGIDDVRRNGRAECPARASVSAPCRTLPGRSTGMARPLSAPRAGSS